MFMTSQSLWKTNNGTYLIESVFCAERTLLFVIAINNQLSIIQTDCIQFFSV